MIIPSIEDHVRTRLDSSNLEVLALRAWVNSTIKDIVARTEPVRLREILTYASTGGKRIRPLLVMISCGAVGGRTDNAVSAAAAVELLHTSSLLHDDIMDGSTLRRDRETVHVRFGVSASILAGDALVGLAFKVISAIETPSKDEIVRRFSSAFMDLCEGQGFDIFSDEGLQAREHRTMVEKKTARLVGACAAIGGLLGGATSEQVEALEHFGLHIGMAYQAQDDLLDAIGSVELTGKSIGLDEDNGRRTFLSALNRNLSRSERVSKVRVVVDDHIRLAFDHLHSLPLTSYRHLLETLTHSLIGREK